MLLPLVGPEEYVKVPAKERAAGTVKAIRDLTAGLNRACGLPVRLSQAGVTEDRLPAVAQATGGARPLPPRESKCPT